MPYLYRATVVRVYDGDTVWLEVDLGFDVRRRDSFRLYGIDTPEMGTEEGTAARERLVQLLDGPGPLEVRTLKDRREKYGRYLAILLKDGVDLNQQLLNEGHAQPYALHREVVER